MSSAAVLDQIYVILKAQGWIFNPNWGPKRRVAHGIYGAFTFAMLIAAIGFQLFQLPAMMKNKENESMFFSLLLFPSQITAAVYVLSLVLSEEKVRDFKVALQEAEQVALEHSSEAMVQKYRRDCRRSVLAFQSITFQSVLCTLGWILTSALTLIIHPVATYENHPTVYSDYDYGLDRNSYFWYSYIYAFEAMQLIQISLNSCAGYCGTLSLCVLVKAQLDLFISTAEEASKIILSATDGDTVMLKEVEGNTMITNQEHNRNMNKFDTRSFINYHQHVLRLMTSIRAIAKPFLCGFVSCTTVVIANSLVITTLDGPASRKMMGLPTSFFLIALLVILLLFLAQLHTLCYRVSSIFSSLALDIRKPAPRKECLLAMLRSSHHEEFPCFLTSSLTFELFYKALDMIWNYYSLAQWMAQKTAG